MIFYFSATGNSKYTAEKIAVDRTERIVSITECIQNNDYAFSMMENETIGFVMPVYFYGLPILIKDFIKKLKLDITEKNYSYLVLTCGGSTGSAAEAFEKILVDKGVRLSAKYAVLMPDNYIPLFTMKSDSEIMSLLDKSDQTLEEIHEKINRREIGDFNTNKGFAPTLLSAAAYLFYKHGRKTKKFYVTDQCTGCRVCEKLCPSAAIRINNGKPEWIKPECTQCFGCLHRCPVQAIQYGKKTEKRGRYYNPKTTK